MVSIAATGRANLQRAWRVGRTDCDLAAFVPGFHRKSGSNFDHGDALIDRTDKRTEIAAHAFRLVHSRNASQRRRIRPVTRPIAAKGCKSFSASNRRYRNGAITEILMTPRNRMDL